MNMKKTGIGLAGAVLIALGYWQSQAPDQKPAPEVLEQASQTQEDVNQVAAGSGKALPAPTSEEAQKPVEKPPESAELASLNEMAQTLYDYTRPEARLTDLVASLEKSHQDPTVARNANSVTGEMAIVRTKSPLPGTRYFHAQYFTDENNQGFNQHMSFEFKPGPTAMNDTVKAVKSTFANLGEPVAERDGYIKWKLDEGRNLWIKKMDVEDLQDDPFNAYTSDDVGTIRVVSELEVHGQDGDDDDHQHN